MWSIDDKNFLFKDGKQIPIIGTQPAGKVSAGSNVCDLLVFHYTASPSMSSAHNNFLNPTAKVSWHLTIDKDGKVYQLYDFRKITWHAGSSKWMTKKGRSYQGINNYGIGIEMVNAGPLTKVGNEYFDWTKRKVPADQVFVDKNGKPWEAYTKAQIETAKALASVITKKYKCVDIVGHEEISPGRKQDPGPAFWATLKEIRGW